MKAQLYDALEECLHMMEKGASLDECLAAYSGIAGDLRPALEAAYYSQQKIDTSIPWEAMNRSRTKILGLAAQLRQARPQRHFWLGFPRLAVSLVILAVLLLTTSGSLFVASAKSLPGDKLYPVKRAVADLRINLTTSTEHKSKVETQYRSQRISEVQQLLDLQLVRKITFEGIVEKITDDQWIVSGIPVSVNKDTIYIGSITVGMLIEVEGSTEKNGYISGDELHLREYQMAGIVEKIARQEWVIAGIPVRITSNTQIGFGIGEGDVVLMLVSSEGDQALYAKAILNLGAPTETVSPAQIMTPIPTTEDKAGNEDDSGSGNGDDKGGSDGNENSNHETITASDDGNEESTPEPEEAEEDSSDSGDDEELTEPEETEDAEEAEDADETEEADETDAPEETEEP